VKKPKQQGHVLEKKKKTSRNMGRGRGRISCPYTMHFVNRI